MNWLAVVSIIALFVLGTSSVVTIDNIKNNETKIEQIKKTKEVITTAKQSDVASKAVENYISNAGYIPNINPNSLNLEATNISDKSLITKFYNAMKYAMIKENIRKPTCEDLAKTKLITLNKCNYIASKKGLYVNIENGTIKIEDTPYKQKESSKTVNSFIKKIESIKKAENANIPNSISSSNKIEIPITSSIITQTINTNKSIPKEIIQKEKIQEEIKNNIIQNIEKKTIINLITKKEANYKIASNKLVNKKSLNKLVEVLPKNNNIPIQVKNFKNSLEPFFKFKEDKTKKINNKTKQEDIRRP